MSKNVLFITNYNYHCLGGVENYNRLIYSSFKNITFHEVSMLENDNKIFGKFNNVIEVENEYKLNPVNYPVTKNILKRVNLLLKKIKNNRALTKVLDKYIVDKKIDKIILSGDYFFSKKIFKKYTDIIYFVLHTNSHMYLNKHKFNLASNEKNGISFFKKTLNMILFNNNFFKYCKNFLVFTEFDKEILCQISKHKKRNWFIVPLPSKFDINQNKFDWEYDFLFCGRLVPFKNISAIAKFAKEFSNYKFYICGDGDESELSKIKNLPNCFLSKPLDNNELLKVYHKCKFLISVSKPYSEGFPFVIAEALSQGIPCIVFNSFIGSKYLIGNNERGLLLEQGNSDYCQKINDYVKTMNYEVTSRNCYEFAKTNLSKNVFINNWKNILD